MLKLAQRRSNSMKIAVKNTGFTLVELLVASTIGAFLIIVAAGTLRAISTSAKMVTSNIDSAAEVRFAAGLISKDLANLYRDPNFANMKFVGTVEESPQGTVSYLTFYTVAGVKARADQPEGDVYEVEYYLLKDQEQSVLFRRLWPYPDPNSETEPAGVLTVIAEDIDAFEVRYFDGSEWSNEWPEEMQTVPQLVEVNIVGRSPRLTTLSVESLTVNLKPIADMIASTAQAGAQQSAAQQGGEQQAGGQQADGQQGVAQQGGGQQGGEQQGGMWGGGGGRQGGGRQGGGRQGGGGQQGGGRQGGGGQQGGIWQGGGQQGGGRQGGGGQQGGGRQGGGGQQGGGRQGSPQQGGGRQGGR
jgi:type II secretion system protein J